MKLILKLAGLIYLVLSIVYRVYMFLGLDYNFTIQNILTFGLNHILGVLVALGIALVLILEHKPSIFILLLFGSLLGIFQNVMDILQYTYLDESYATIDLWIYYLPFVFHGLTLLGLLVVHTKPGKVSIVFMQTILIAYYGYQLYSVNFISPFETTLMQTFFILYAYTHVFYGVLVMMTVLYWFRQNKVERLTN